MTIIIKCQCFISRETTATIFIKYTGEVGFVIDWDYNSEDNVAMIYSMCSDTEYNNNYIAKFKKYLLTLNYVTSDNVTYTNNVDNLKIVVGNTMDDFLHISLINI